MKVLVFEPLVSSHRGGGQPFAWSAAILDDNHVLAKGYWIASLREQDGYDVHEPSMAAQGYLEVDLVVRDCFNDAAAAFCQWLGQHHDDEHVLVATSEPRVTFLPGQALLTVLRRDAAARWWRPYVDHIDTRLLAWRHNLPEPPVVWGALEPDLANLRLRASLDILHTVPVEKWLAWDPPTPETCLHLDEFAQLVEATPSC